MSSQRSQGGAQGEQGDEDALVAFFRALQPDARREYEMLAERDRQYGEDVARERRDRAAGSAS